MAQIYHTDSHDVVAGKLAELIRKNNAGRLVVTVNTPAGDRPDIILRDESAGKDVAAIEVETADSLGSENSGARWKKFAAQYPALQAIVPKGTAARAHRIAKKLGIKVRLQEY